ncbi:MAG TPA: TetR/AcrR family transcriptional regulator [Acidimicrobiales bacterium]|nr:TetR/AcrR family transcriptional regulator [Acidimicrobiales bacterium]
MATKSRASTSTRGRPVNADGEATRARLLDAAAAICAETGFDGATVSQIARRAGLTPAAIYNYYDSREDLLYAAGRRGLEQVTAVVPAGAGADAARLIATAYLRPELAQTRRLLAELHVASNREPRLAALLAEWHHSWSAALRRVLPPGDPDPGATVKALFLLLLGLCHLDDLESVRARPTALARTVEALVEVLVPQRRA